MTGLMGPAERVLRTCAAELIREMMQGYVRRLADDAGERMARGSDPYDLVFDPDEASKWLGPIALAWGYSAHERMAFEVEAVWNKRGDGAP